MSRKHDDDDDVVVFKKHVKLSPINKKTILDSKVKSKFIKVPKDNMEDTDLFEKTRLDGSVSETHLK
jgi:hypothetical protein